mgnify:CR=1 FL=1
MYHDLFSYQGFDFIEALMKRLNISIQLNQRGLDGIPKEGPCVVICNHPFGAMDGVSILHILKEVRPDVKVMANFLLKEIGRKFIEFSKGNFPCNCNTLRS